MPNDRCVCGYPKSRHVGDDLLCPSQSGHFATRDLPAGCTCVDCYNFKRFCGPILGYKGTETSCDFFPVRFVSIAGLRASLDDAEAAKGAM
jgi:hypothetical protein